MISPSSLLLLAGALAVSSVLRSAESAEPQFVSIFNGKDLTGWTTAGGRGGAAGANLWRAENGVLIGQSDEKKTGGTLRTEKSYKNFILEVDVKYMPPADSGITLRSPAMQMQIGTSHSQKIELTGSFYQGALGYPDYATAKDAWKYFLPGRWNTIRLEARGAIFTVSINGQIVIKYSDDKHPDAGPISVQVHQDEDMKIEFKNMRIAELK